MQMGKFIFTRDAITTTICIDQTLNWLHKHIFAINSMELKRWMAANSIPSARNLWEFPSNMMNMCPKLQWQRPSPIFQIMPCHPTSIINRLEKTMLILILISVWFPHIVLHRRHLRANRIPPEAIFIAGAHRIWRFGRWSKRMSEKSNAPPVHGRGRCGRTCATCLSNCTEIGRRTKLSTANIIIPTAGHHE